MARMHARTGLGSSPCTGCIPVGTGSTRSKPLGVREGGARGRDALPERKRSAGGSGRPRYLKARRLAQPDTSAQAGIALST